jgi:hypothetical protein
LETTRAFGDHQKQAASAIERLRPRPSARGSFVGVL